MAGLSSFFRPPLSKLLTRISGSVRRRSAQLRPATPKQIASSVASVVAWGRQRSVFGPATTTQLSRARRRRQSSASAPRIISSTTTPTPTLTQTASAVRPAHASEAANGAGERGQTGESKGRLVPCPFFFETGYALFAKQTPKPFPSFFQRAALPAGQRGGGGRAGESDLQKLYYVNGKLVRGRTNGDDAVLAEPGVIAVADGVGAWSTKEKGHAGLWARLMLHFWSVEADQAVRVADTSPDPVSYLDRALERTREATTAPNEWNGTTTVCSAIIRSDSSAGGPARPVLYITQLGDSSVMVIRPRTGEIVFKTAEQWHWFDCPRQLGTNSPDSPGGNAVVDRFVAQEDDIVLAMSDGVLDNLWDHEIASIVKASLLRWDVFGTDSLAAGPGSAPARARNQTAMQYVAEELVAAAKKIAFDPFAESPYMERAVEEGLSMEGGKPDDISVVVARCKRCQ